MIRVRHCNIKFQTPITEFQRARITKRRIEQILSRYFGKFDSVEGTIRVKNLKIDLGTLSDAQLDFDFFKGFERACEELAEKIETVRQEEGAKASDWELSHDPTNSFNGKSASHQLSKSNSSSVESPLEIDRLIALIETLEFVPNAKGIEELAKKYNRLYSEELSDASKQLLSKLVNQIQGPKDEIKEDEVAQETTIEISDSLAVIHKLLDETKLDSNWFSNMLEAYKNHFGEDMPQSLQNVLLSTRKLQSDKLETQKKTYVWNSLYESLVGFLKVQDSTSEIRRLESIIEEIGSDLGEDLIALVSSAYQDKFNFKLPYDSQELLEGFLIEEEDSESASKIVQELKGFLKAQESSSETKRLESIIEDLWNDLSEDYISQISTKYKDKFNISIPFQSQSLLYDFYLERKNLTKESKQIVQGLWRFLKAQKPTSETQKIESIIEEIGSNLTKDWITQISRKYRENYSSKIPWESYSLLERFSELNGGSKDELEIIPQELGNFLKSQKSTSETKRIESIVEEIASDFKDEWLAQIAQKYRKKFGERISQEAHLLLLNFLEKKRENKLSKQLQKDLKRSLKSETVTSETERLQIILEEIGNDFSGDLIEQISKLYLKKFGSKLSTESSSLLMKLTEEISNKAQQEKILREINKSEAKTPIIDQLKTYLLTLKQTVEVGNLSSIVGELETRTSNNWFDEILKLYKVRFQSVRLFEVQKMLLDFSKTIQSQAIPDDSEKWQKEITNDLNERFKSSESYEFIFGLLDKIDFNKAWIDTLSKDYKDHFGKPMPQDLYNVLLNLEQSFHSDGESSSKHENPNQEQAEKASREKLRIYLRTLKINKVVTNLFSLIEDLKDDTTGNWFTAFSNAYKFKFGKKYLLEVQSVLLNFKDLNDTQEKSTISENIFTEFKERFKNRIDEIGKIEQEKFKEKAKFEKERCLSFFQSKFDVEEFGKTWVDELAIEYKSEFKEKIPKGIKKIILSLSKYWEEVNKSINGEVASSIYDQIKRHLDALDQSEIKAKLLEIVEELNADISDNWFQQIVAKYQSKFDIRVPSSGQRILLDLDHSIKPLQKVEIPKKELDEALEKIEDYFHSMIQVESIEDQTISDYEELSFIYDQLMRTEFQQGWLPSLDKNYRNHFREALPQYIKSVLFELINVSNENKKSIIESEPEPKSKMETESQSETNNPGLTTGERRDKVKETISSTIKSIFEFDSKTETSEIEEKHEQFDDQLNNQGSISERLISYLSDLTTSGDTLSLIEISKSLGKKEEQNWFKELLNLYEKKFGNKMPFSAQSTLLKFASTIKSEALETLSIKERDQIANEFEGYFKAQTKSKLGSNSTTSKKEDADLISDHEALNYILKLLDQIEFNFSWFDNVLKAYRAYFGTSIPESIQAILLEVGSKSTLNILENKVDEDESTIAERLKQFILSLDQTKETAQFLKLIASINENFTEDWMEVVLQKYSEKIGETISLSLQSSLLKFAKTISSNEDVAGSHSAIDGLKKTIKSRLVSKSETIDFDELSENEILHFVLNIVQDLEMNASWHEDLLTVFKGQFGGEIPERIKNAFNKVLTGSTNTNYSDQSQQVFSVKSIQLKAYLFTLPESQETADLLGLIESTNELRSNAWFQNLMEVYKELYQINMPIPLQAILLNFGKILSSRPNEVLDFLILATRSETTDQLWYDELLKKFEKRFNKPLSDSVKEVMQKLIGKSEQELAKAVRKALQQLLGGSEKSDEIKEDLKLIAPVENTVEVSNRAKILQLKVALKAFKNRDTDQIEEIISNAGIITGWVLWKKVFEDLGWLQEGEFYDKEGYNTGCLAANWLSRIHGYTATEINSFGMHICNLKSDEVEFYSDSKMNEILAPVKINESIDSYYDDLLLFWPILQLDQKEEFFEMFIRREGVLSPTAKGWRLNVVTEPYDALMINAPIPWPLSYIQFPWTKNVIEVEW